jgi:hypothetical protein
MQSSNYVVLLGVLATTVHAQHNFLHSTFGGVNSFSSSFSQSWSFFRGQDGRVQKTFQSTEIRDGHVEKQVQSTDITNNIDGMKRKDTKLVCRDGKCEEVVEEVRSPVKPPSKSPYFLAPVASQPSEANALRSHMNALLEHIMGHGAADLPMEEQHAWNLRGQPQLIVSIPSREQQPLRLSPWKVNVVHTDIPHPPPTYAETHMASPASGLPMFKLGGIFCGTMVLLSLLLIAAKCRQADVSAREMSLQGLAAPLAPGEEAVSGLPAAKLASKDVAGAKAAVSKYLPQLYAFAQVKAGVTMYLPRVYARATA